MNILPLVEEPHRLQNSWQKSLSIRDIVWMLSQWVTKDYQKMRSSMGFVYTGFQVYERKLRCALSTKCSPIVFLPPSFYLLYLKRMIMILITLILSFLRVLFQVCFTKKFLISSQPMAAMFPDIIRTGLIFCTY